MEITHWEKRLEKELPREIRHSFANKSIFRSKLGEIKTKVVFWSVIRPIVVYGCEAWVFKEGIIQRLSVFGSKILRKIFGPNKEDNGIWRIETNKELNEAINRRNTIIYLSR